MCIAVLYDIHGNLPALEVVLAELATIELDLILVGGDVVWGPFPQETLARLLNLTIPVNFIRGNSERELFSLAQNTAGVSLSDNLRTEADWILRQFETDLIADFGSWPEQATYDVSDFGHVLFCHATPRNDHEIFTKITPEEYLQPLFKSVKADLVVCGHTHMQFQRHIGTVQVVNAGSVGLPYGTQGAHWVLLGSQVEFRCTPYDMEEAAERIMASGYPNVERLVERYILQTPSEEEALAFFEEHAFYQKES